MNVAAGRSSALLYTRVVADARRGLSFSEIGDITRVSERSVQYWAQGRTTPETKARDSLLELKYVIEGLAEIFEDEGIEIWLHSRQRSLGGESPLTLLKEGRFVDVLDAIERLAGGPKR